MKTLFLDTEFTELSQSGSLLSIALIDRNDRWFYGVFSDVDTSHLSPWHQENIVPYLPLTDLQLEQLPDTSTYLVAGKDKITETLLTWLKAYDQLEIWADVPAYDWVLFCELFGGARQLPKQIHYIVRDLATFFVLKGIDPDTDRFKFVYEGKTPLGLIRHNALGDAINTKDCYKKLVEDS